MHHNLNSAHLEMPVFHEAFYQIILFQHSQLLGQEFTTTTIGRKKHGKGGHAEWWKADKS